MPPEPLSLDRKDLALKDRKHERGAGCDALGVGVGSSSSSTPRWREPSQAPRDFTRSSPRRPPPVYRQGGCYYQVYPEESGVGQGCTPSRSNDRFWLEDESFRPSSARYGSGRSSSSSRESRGSFGRSPYSDSGDFSRQHHEIPVTAPRSLAILVSPVSHTTSPLPLKDQHAKSSGGVDDGSGTGHRYDRDHSLGSIGWKPMKWTRPCSLSSSKTGRSELEEAVVEASVPAGKETPIRSPVTSPLPSDEGAPKKKQRLGWGQGLAKYEKKKVVGSEDVAIQNGSAQCAISDKATSDDMGPKLMSATGCTSPATLCSAVSGSSSGLFDKPCIKAADNDTSRHSDSPDCGLQNCANELSKLDPLEVNITTLTSLLIELLQPEDACSGDSSLTKHTSMDKLLGLKEHISKELEKTECEIDSLENELKTLNGDGKNDPCHSSFTLQVDCASDPCVESADVSSQVPLYSNPSKECVLASSVALARESLVHSDLLEEHDAEVKDVDDDSVETSSAMEISKSDDPKFTSCPFDGLDAPANVCGHGDGHCVDEGSISVFANFDMSLNSWADNKLIATIMDSNRYAARRASHMFDKAMETDPPPCDIWGSDKILSCRRSDGHIKEKIAMRKRLLKFKEQVLTLKFRAFHHLWKEDLRLLSMRKHRPKSHKRFELGTRVSQTGPQRHRSSVRSRFTLPAGNIILVPTTEIEDFTTKLLSDSQIKLYRSNLKVPALILEDERRYSRFITNNGLIEDPTTFEEERAMINPWTHEEKEVFMETLATFGKDFTKISSVLNHKTTADCIEFYYKNQKSESFKEVKKRLNLRKQLQCLPTNTYLVTSGTKWNRGVNAPASLDMLGAASMVAPHNYGNTRNQQKYRGKPILGSYHSMNCSYGSCVSLERAGAAEIPRYDREAAAADALAGICGDLSSEAVSSCVTSSIDHTEKMSYMAMGRPLVPEITQNINEEDTCSDEDCGRLESVDWTDEEKSSFIRALGMYGKDFARISSLVKTRSREQCKVFFSKARKCLALDVIHSGPGNGGTPMSVTNGERSDTDDAFAHEMDSAICSTQSCSKLDTDFTQSMANTSSEGFMPMHSETDRSSERYETGGSNQGEVEAEIDRLTSVSNQDELVKLDGSLQSDKIPKELDHEVAEDFVVDRKQEEGVNDHVSAPVITACIMDSEQLKPHVAKVEQDDTVGNVPDDGLKTEVDTRPFLAPWPGFVNRKGTNGNQAADNNASLCSSPNSNVNGDVSTFVPNYQHQLPPKRLPSLRKKPRVIMPKQESLVTLPSDKVLPDPSSVSFERLRHLATQYFPNFEEHGSKRLSNDFFHEYLLGNPTMNQLNQPLHILRGHPLQVLSQKEADPIDEKPVLLENISKEDGNSHLNLFSVPAIQNEKSNGSVISHSRSLHLPKGENQPEARLRPCSQSSCEETEQSHRTGDFKLFGQILSNPSSLQKSSSSQEFDGQPLSPKLKKYPFIKPSKGCKDLTIFANRTRSIGHPGLEEQPLRSFGYWDGNKIQTGYASLPESTTNLLSKYEGSQAGASLYPVKDNPTMAEYQQACKQSSAAEVKRLESFAELQKRNSFETVSGLQQQGVAPVGCRYAGERDHG